MSKKIIILIFMYLPLFSAFELQMLNPEFIALGGIVSIHPIGLNPATSAHGYGLTLSTNYTNLFGIKDLHCWDYAMNFKPGEKYGYSCKVNSVGNNVYRENTYIFGISRKFRKKISIGISLSYYDLMIKDFQRNGSFGINLGADMKLTDNLQASLLFININRPKICNNQEMLPEFFAIGLHWIALKRINLNAELYKDTLYPFTTKFGAELLIHSNIAVLLGTQLDPDRFSAGISCRIKNLKFNSAILHHQQLPYTYYFGCNLNIK